MTDLIERLRAAIAVAGPDATDGQWATLLAEAMNAADEIAALRALVETAYRTGYADGAEDQQRDGFTHKDAVNEGWHNFILSKQEPERVEVVDEGEIGNDAIAAIGGDRG